MSVGSTTSLTATLAFGGLLGFGWASGVLSRGADPFRMAAGGALVGIPAFLAVLAAAPLGSVTLFAAGVLGIGLGGGIFSHGTLTATMNSAPKEQAGLALGAWGAVQATAAGVAVALGGVLRDVISVLAGQGIFGPALARPATGYAFVYGVELLLLVATVVAMSALIGSARHETDPRFNQEFKRSSP
jgi:BCD family chlorophyll transporter-like MFS transporter